MTNCDTPNPKKSRRSVTRRKALKTIGGAAIIPFVPDIGAKTNRARKRAGHMQKEWEEQKVIAPRTSAFKSPWWQIYASLPHLRGFWPFSSIDENGAAMDASNHGRTLTNNNAATFALSDSYIPHAEFSGTEYLSRADEPGLNITADLTFGCWVYFDTAGTPEGIMGKGSGTNSISPYFLYRATDTTVRFHPADGTTSYQVQGSAVEAGKWVFVAGRFAPAVSIGIFVNATKFEYTTGLPTALNITTMDFTLGALDGGVTTLQGRIALPFLCAAGLSDDHIKYIYHSTKHLFQ